MSDIRKIAPKQIRLKRQPGTADHVIDRHPTHHNSFFMTHMPGQMTRSDDPSKKPSGREQLQRALDVGPSAFTQQLKLLMALSQVNGATSSTMPHPEKPLSIRQARLAVLAENAANLSDEQVKTLVQETLQIPEASTRIPLLAKLALRLPAAEYRSLMRDCWQQAKEILDPTLRAQCLFDIAPLLILVHDEPAASSSLLRMVNQAVTIKSVEARLRSLIALIPRLPRDMALRTYRRILDELTEARSDLLSARCLAGMATHVPEDMIEPTLTLTQQIVSPVERTRAMTTLARYLPTEWQPRVRELALNAILEIESDEDRAEALIAFAPNLESASPLDDYPAMLEKALLVAIMISRRPVRARVLVALASHLTPDLQGEALAAVHVLPGEREKAILLADLAPQLPGNMLVASLAVAHTMREQDARVHALCALAHYVPDHARHQTILDAMAAASNLPHHYERVRALVSLLDILPPNLIDQALTNALDTTRLIENENARARSLSVLGPHLPDRLLEQALSIATELENPQQRLNALVGLVNQLDGPAYQQIIGQMLLCARQMPLEYRRARALSAIVPFVQSEYLGEVLELTDKLDDPVDRFNVTIAVVQQLPPEQRPPLVAKAWSLLRRIEDGYDRATALAALAGFLPSSMIEDMSLVAVSSIQDVPDEYDKASAISLLVPLVSDDEIGQWSTLPDGITIIRRGIESALMTHQQGLRAQLLAQGVALWVDHTDTEQSFILWKQIVRRLVTLPLSDVLLCMGALLPLVRHFAGDEGWRIMAESLGIKSDETGTSTSKE
jgi:hypothetical protein